MEQMGKLFLSEEIKEKYISAMADELSLLRTKANVSQEELANIIGVSRQTYGALERKSRKMTWGTYMSLLSFYNLNDKTSSMIRASKAFPTEMMNKIGKISSGEKEIKKFQEIKKDIFEVLDEKALETIKTVMMIEYSRCSNLPSEAIVKYFEGIHLSKTNEQDASTANAIKNIKGKM